MLLSTLEMMLLVMIVMVVLLSMEEMVDMNDAGVSGVVVIPHVLMLVSQTIVNPLMLLKREDSSTPIHSLIQHVILTRLRYTLPTSC